VILIRLLLIALTGVSTGAAAVLPPIMREPLGAAVGAGAAALALMLAVILVRTRPSP
jgi:hypothetical protein